VLVFYLILKNLLKLIFERHRQALGVNLKTKLIIAFILISLPATLSHLFTTIYTNSALESWLSNQRETAKQNAQSISTAYYRNLNNLLEMQGSLVKNALINNPEILNSPKDINFVITADENQAVVTYHFNSTLNIQENKERYIIDTDKALLKADSVNAHFTTTLSVQTMLNHANVKNNLFYDFYVRPRHLTEQTAFYELPARTTSAGNILINFKIYFICPRIDHCWCGILYLESL